MSGPPPPPPPALLTTAFIKPKKIEEAPVVMTSYEKWVRKYPFHAACQSNDLVMIQHILSFLSGQTDKVPSTYQFTSFTLPLLDLCKSVSDVNMVDVEGWTCLQYSSWEGHSDSVRLLLNNKAEINKGNAFNSNALHLSAGMGHVDVVRALLEFATEETLNSLNNDKQTPYQLAAAICENNKGAILELLSNKS